MWRFLLILVAGFVMAPVNGRCGDFFRPGPAAPAALPARRIFPQGRTMHIGGYSPGISPVKQLGGVVPLDLALQSGFTVAGPWYGPFEKSKAMAERAAAFGMHTAVQLEVPPVLRFSKEESSHALELRVPRMAALPESELRAWVHENMNNSLLNPVLNRAVSCWAVTPEELRWWKPPELAYEQCFLKAVHDFDPQRRPAFMYEPNHRNAASLLKTGPGQGFVLEGSYVHRYGWDVRRSLRINWAMDQMTSAAAVDHRVVVPGLQLSQDMPGFTAKDLDADPDARMRLRRLLRHDVYLGIVRGAQGFQVWSLYPFREKLTTYLELVRGYGEVFRELTTAPLCLQEPVLFGECRDDVTVAVVKGPEFIGASAGDGTLDAVEGKIDMRQLRWPAVRLANIAYGDYHLLILVNSAEQAVQVRLSGVPAAARLTTLSGADASRLERHSGDIDVDMDPFAALVLRVSGPATSGR